MITYNIHSLFPTIEQAFRHALFQVGTVITTTGYASTDFNKWPEFSKFILVMLMFSGACAGSTGGGMKVSRLVIMLKFPMLLLINPYTWKEIKIRKNKKNKKEGHSI